ncbi:MAG: hypothetical protein JXN63_07820 [Candidatus Delongbacteria bacterium]|nr:hypothetical protein [Candidatus Delongbacteria bacterium]
MAHLTKEENIQHNEISINDIFLILWKGRLFLFSICFFFVLCGVAYVLISTPMYRSSITLYSLTESSQSGPLSAMVRQFGVVSTSAISNSNYNIPDVVKSRTLSEKIIMHEWEIDGYDQKTSLLKYFDDLTGAEKPEEVVTEEEINEWNEDKLHKYSKYFAKERISMTTDPETNLITVYVDMEQPELARDISNFISVFVSNWVNENQRMSAQKNLDFVNERLFLAEEDLIKAENDLKSFRETNRSILNSPDLQLELQRLQRQVLIKQEVYLTLVKQKEIVQIEENRYSDVIRIVDSAIREKKPYKPNIKVILALSVVTGIIFGSLILITSYLFTNGFSKYNIKKYLFLTA